MTPRMLLLVLLALMPLAIVVNMREVSPPVSTDAATGTFDEEFLEHLGTVREAADALVDLGERRERNLLVVGQRQSAMNAALDATDAWLSRQAAHHDDPAVVAYRAGANAIRQAMADAQSAFFRFDWDGVAAANNILKQGVADITRAQALLQPGAGA